MKRQNDIWSLLHMAIPVIGMVALIWLLLATLSGIPQLGISSLSSSTETRMVIVILIAVASMLAILTIMAIIFKQMNLSDPTQALGLPEGSIRALIALLLLMMFVIFSIYLFRQVVGFDWEYRSGLTELQVNTFEPSDIFQKQGPIDGKYNVWLRIKDVNSAGEQFAQQIFTAMLTLVTAVSSFYFASRGMEGHQSAKQNEILTTELKVTGINPNSGEAAKGKIVITNLAGTGLANNAQVKLRRAGESDIDASDIEFLNESRILCTFDLTEKLIGKWDVIIINPDSKEAKLVDGFEIK